MFPAADAAKTLLLSDLHDGWMTLGNDIAATLRNGLYRFSWSDDDPDACSALQYLDFSTENPTRRLVHAMKDPRWTFF